MKFSQRFTCMLVICYCASIGAAQPRRLPRWWKEVDHMHIAGAENNTKLDAYVHPEGDLEDEHIIASYNLGPSQYAVDVKQILHSDQFYLAGQIGIGGFVRILSITPGLQFQQVHAQPEALFAVDTPIAITASHNGRYLYVRQSSHLDVFELMPNQTLRQLQPKQVTQLPIRLPEGIQANNIITTPFADHNFVIDLNHPAESIITYPIQADGTLGNGQSFRYNAQVDQRTDRTMVRFFSETFGSQIAINGVPKQIGNIQVYELEVTAYGANRGTVDTFHLDPHTGVLTLRKSRSKRLQTIFDKEERQPGWIYSAVPFDQNEFELPQRWRAKIAQEIVMRLQEEEDKGTHPGPLGKDVAGLIAEFATGSKPTRRRQQQPPN